MKVTFELSPAQADTVEKWRQKPEAERAAQADKMFSGITALCANPQCKGVAPIVNGHIMARTGHPRLVNYHNNGADDLEKIVLYDEVLRGVRRFIDGAPHGLLGDAPKGGIEVEATPAATPEPEPEPKAPTPKATKRQPEPEPEPQEGASEDQLGVLGKAIIDLVRKNVRVEAKGKDEDLRLRVDSIERDIAELGKAKPAEIDAEAVNRLITEALATHVRRIEIVQPDGSTKPVTGLAHRQLPQLLAWLRADVPVWCWGAAGAGKSHLFYQLSEAMGIEGRLLPCDETLTVAKLVGYKNLVNGQFVEGFLYPLFRQGGLQGFDEIDANSPGIACTNSLLANDRYLFPDGDTVMKHNTWRTIAFANTKGTGPVAGYTARTRLDAATLDRWAVVELKYDEALETAIATGVVRPGSEPDWELGQPASQDLCVRWTEWVQRVRKHCGNSVLVSPRASYNGVKALRVGIRPEEVAEALVFKLCTDDTKARLLDAAGTVPTE
jgi:cobaltochelatase CobS